MLDESETSAYFDAFVPFSMTMMKIRKSEVTRPCVSDCPGRNINSGARDPSPLYYRMFHRAIGWTPLVLSRPTSLHITECYRTLCDDFDTCA